MSFFLLFGRLGFCSPTELLEPNLIIGEDISWVEVGISKILLQLIAYGEFESFHFWFLRVLSRCSSMRSNLNLIIGGDISWVEVGTSKTLL